MYKRKYFETKLFFKVNKIFKILIKLNIVNFIKRKDMSTNKYMIFLNLDSKLKLSPMVKKNNKHISYFNIKRVCKKKKWLAVISTPKGLLTTKDCLKNKTGGLILFNIFVKI